MKIIVTTHSDGSTSVNTTNVTVVKPGDTPTSVEYEVDDSYAQDFLDNPNNYEINEGKVVKKDANR